MAKKERRLYDPAKAVAWSPRKEWVEMADGSEVCAWELSVPEAFRVAESAQRHPQDLRPGPNESEAAVWLVALSVRKDDEPGSPRIWGDMDFAKLLALNPVDFSNMLVAARFLLQSEPASEAGLEDFTDPTSASTGPISPAGASSNSTGCLVS